MQPLSINQKTKQGTWYRTHHCVEHTAIQIDKHAYHIQIVHKLEEGYAARQAMCYDLLDAVRNENLMQHVLFSDEASFHTCGHVNRHNCWIWADEQPNALQEWERDSPKVNVWMGNTKSKVCGPYMFAEPTVTDITDLHLLQQFLEPQLIQDDILESVAYQQDGAPPHFSLIVRIYLNDTFPRRWIGRESLRLWAPGSPNLTLMDFFAWGFIKAKVYQVKINGFEQPHFCRCRTDKVRYVSKGVSGNRGTMGHVLRYAGSSR